MSEPIVLGIEEYLQGPLLSYINTLGYVSLGFESGQHDNKQAILKAMDETLDQVELKEICDFMKESAIQLDEFTTELTTYIQNLKKQ